MSRPLPELSAPPRPVRTVLGDIPFDRLGIVDGHNHAWIEPVPGAQPGAPVLNDYAAILAELRLFRAAGGSGLLDCQPPGCGRDARQLARLARESGVDIIASTGFHRTRYYPAGYPLFALSAGEAADFFTRELTAGVSEAEGTGEPIRAGFIKIALETQWADTPQNALQGAAIAAWQTGALVEIHTEKGALAEKAVLYFESQGVAPQQLVLCHMDKRPNFALHSELARYGVLLEYDTFHRPKYDPERNLWPLIRQMVDAGLSSRVVLATDMAETSLYQANGGPGLASLPAEICARLQQMDVPMPSIQQMLGGNIARRLAGLTE